MLVHLRIENADETLDLDFATGTHSTGKSTRKTSLKVVLTLIISSAGNHTGDRSIFGDPILTLETTSVVSEPESIAIFGFRENTNCQRQCKIIGIAV